MKAQEYCIRWQKYCLGFAHSEWSASQHIWGISTCHYNLQLCTWRQNCPRNILEWTLAFVYQPHSTDSDGTGECVWLRLTAELTAEIAADRPWIWPWSWSEWGCFPWEVLTCHVQTLQEYFHLRWVWHPFHLSVLDVSFHSQRCEHAACFVKALSTQFDYYRAAPRNGKSRQWQRSTGVYKVYSW